jgi:SAM-dependent methyltransferase
VNPWLESAAPRGSDYDARWRALEAAGRPIHGEADCVGRLAPRSVLDAGCGTGRVAAELARRGIDVCGVDLDPAMLGAARDKAPGVRWVEADLADPALDLGARFDVAVAAGNVMIFLAPGTLPDVLVTLARHLAPGGAIVAGFQLGQALTLDTYDEAAGAAGVQREARWATWEGAPFGSGGDYAVSVHRLPLRRSPPG